MNRGTAPCPHEQFEGDELRCGCGRLLVRRRPEGLELKCPRCKQVTLLRVRELGKK